MLPNSRTVLARGKNAEVLAWGDHRVLKLFRPGYSRNAIAAEFLHAGTAQRLGIPTPRAEEIVDFEGRTGIVLERVEGPTLFHVAATGAMPAERVARMFFEIQTAIHGCDGSAFPPIEARLASKILRAQGVPEATVRRALDALHRLPGDKALCHGDFHPANVILTDQGPRVLDWLDAARGCPGADAARSLLLLELARPAQVDPALRRAFLNAYRDCLSASGKGALPEPWRLPVAVARLAEPLDAAERTALLARVAMLVG